MPQPDKLDSPIIWALIVLRFPTNNLTIKRQEEAEIGNVAEWSNTCLAYRKTWIRSSALRGEKQVSENHMTEKDTLIILEMKLNRVNSYVSIMDYPSLYSQFP